MNGVNQVQIDVLPNGIVDRRNAAKALGKSAKTLSEWARSKTGPMHFRIGGRAYYLWADVQEYIRIGMTHPAPRH